MKIRDEWNKIADEHNQFANLSIDEVEEFADNLLSEKENELKILCEFITDIGVFEEIGHCDSCARTRGDEACKTCDDMGINWKRCDESPWEIMECYK